MLFAFPSSLQSVCTQLRNAKKKSEQEGADGVWEPKGVKNMLAEHTHKQKEGISPNVNALKLSATPKM